jgi:hypothetical protein
MFILSSFHNLVSVIPHLVLPRLVQSLFSLLPSVPLCLLSVVHVEAYNQHRLAERVQGEGTGKVVWTIRKAGGSEDTHPWSRTACQLRQKRSQQ